MSVLKGLGWSDLPQLRDWLGHIEREQEHLRDEYCDIIDGIDFLNAENALQVPGGEYDKSITVRKQWVAIKGFIKLSSSYYKQWMERDGVDLRFMINTTAIKTGIILMDSVTFRIWSVLLCNKNHHISTTDAFRLTMNVLNILDAGVASQRQILIPKFLKELYQNTLFEQHGMLTVQERSVRALRRIQTRISDPYGIVAGLSDGEWLIAHSRVYFDDGWFHAVTMPTWMLSIAYEENDMGGAVIHDHSHNRVNDWQYYAPVRESVELPPQVIAKQSVVPRKPEHQSFTAVG